MDVSRKQVKRNSGRLTRLTGLLIAVSQRKDEAAFSEIYKLVGNKSYSLAYQITHNKELAEETVQEAMLRIWRFAPSYDATRNPRNWILTIVATTAVTSLNKFKNSHKLDKKGYARVTADSDPEKEEQNESLTKLRQIIDSLPQGPRQLLALYFGAGMSQEAIGKALGMPQRTVSDKFNKTLNLIKSHLKEAGFTTLGSLPLGQELSDAICNNGQLTALAQTRIHSALSQAASKLPQEPNPDLAPTPPIASFQKFWILSAVVPMLVTGAFVFQSYQAPDRSTPAAATKPLDLRWTFNERPASDLMRVAGRWEWEKPSESNPGAMHIAPNPGVILMLPMALPKIPCMITLRLKMAYFGNGPILAIWSDGTSICARKDWTLAGNPEASHETFLEYYFYVHEHRVYSCAKKNQIQVITEFDEIPSSRKFALLLSNYVLESIAIREIQPQDLPDSIKDTHQMSVPKTTINTGASRIGNPLSDQSFKKTWNFEKGPAAAFQIIRGQWKWHPPKNKTKAGMQCHGPSKFATLKLPPYVPPSPLKVTVRSSAVKIGMGSSLLSWHGTSQFPIPYRLWPRPVKITTPNAVTTHFILNRHIVTFVGDTLASVSEFEIPYPSKSLILTFRNTRLQEVTLENADLKSMPAEVFQAQKLIEQLKKQGVKPKMFGTFIKSEANH